MQRLWLIRQYHVQSMQVQKRNWRKPFAIHSQDWKTCLSMHAVHIPPSNITASSLFSNRVKPSNKALLFCQRAHRHQQIRAQCISLSCLPWPKKRATEMLIKERENVVTRIHGGKIHQMIPTKRYKLTWFDKHLSSCNANYNSNM